MKVKTDLHFKPVDIKTALKDYAGQENCDGGIYDVAMQAADYIRELETALKALNEPHMNYIPDLDRTVDQLLGEDDG